MPSWVDAVLVACGVLPLVSYVLIQFLDFEGKPGQRKLRR